MEFFAFHGCFKEERIIGNHFLVNASFETETKIAETTDDLTKTINYQKVYLIIKAEMNKPSKLLENVARRIYDKLTENFPTIIDLTIKISKINPSLGGKVNKVSITLSK